MLYTFFCKKNKDRSSQFHDRYVLGCCNRSICTSCKNNTEPTASSQTVTKLTATPSIRVAYQKIGYTQIENAPFDLVQAVQDHMALNLINDEATDMLSTVYDAVSPTNWVRGDGTVITSDDIATNVMKRDAITRAKSLIANQGHDVRPGNLVLFLTPKAYHELLTDTNLNNFYQWAQPGITQRGVLESIKVNSCYM